MFSNLSAALHNTSVDYPISDSKLPFAQYIEKTRSIIEERRLDLVGSDAEKIINANCPFEMIPSKPVMNGDRIKHGVLLIHGLLDSPFTLQNLGSHLQGNGILCRSILLPGHGTNPVDLLTVSYHDWIQAVRYGVESLKHDVDEIHLIGYSTGATLSAYQALHDSHVKSITLLSPAIKIRVPIDGIVNWESLSRWLTTNKRWISKGKETNYVKYTSVPFNAPMQVSKLTMVISELLQQHSLITPLLMVLSREDETISSHRAIDFFSSLGNRESKMLLYSSCEHQYPDPRIETKNTIDNELRIKHYSHVSIPFAPNNIHYGQHGDYEFAAHINAKHTIYGAYSQFERRILRTLKTCRLIKNRYAQLTYNPDFEYMAQTIENFILSK